MKKAVIATGGKQYLVAPGDKIEVELLEDKKKAEFTPLLLIDGDKTIVGSPHIKNTKVSAEVTEGDVKKDKVTSIRFKAKKRVRKIRGHRQRKTVLTIKTISDK